MNFYIIYLILINLTAFVFMAVDKNKAKHHQWRIPERTLFFLGLVFGSFGILSGMYLLRHKNKHIKFVILIPLFLVVQVFIIYKFRYLIFY